MSLKSFTDAYIECALWSSTDNADDGGGEPLDQNYSVTDIARTTREQMEKDCYAFYEANEHLWADEAKYNDEQAGHDFWLTRNGHGAGFWDRGIKNGDKLTKATKPYGSFDLYIGDDGKVHGS